MRLLDRGKIDVGTTGSVDIAAVEQDVAAADQLGQARRCLCMMAVERDARFVEIEKRKPCALPFRRQWRGAADWITARWFDFLNGRAEIGEQAGAIAGRGGAPDLDNPQMR